AGGAERGLVATVRALVAGPRAGTGAVNGSTCVDRSSAPAEKSPGDGAFFIPAGAKCAIHRPFCFALLVLCSTAGESCLTVGVNASVIAALCSGRGQNMSKLGAPTLRLRRKKAREPSATPRPSVHLPERGVSMKHSARVLAIAAAITGIT